MTKKRADRLRNAVIAALTCTLKDGEEAETAVARKTENGYEIIVTVRDEE